MELSSGWSVKRLEETRKMGTDRRSVVAVKAKEIKEMEKDGRRGSED